MTPRSTQAVASMADDAARFEAAYIAFLDGERVLLVTDFPSHAARMIHRWAEGIGGAKLRGLNSTEILHQDRHIAGSIRLTRADRIKFAVRGREFDRCVIDPDTRALTEQEHTLVASHIAWDGIVAMKAMPSRIVAADKLSERAQHQQAMRALRGGGQLCDACGFPRGECSH